MGKKTGKRKAGHLGFQANEIAFIEEEMAAIAQEYGLEIDEDVAKNVSNRRDAKKNKRKKILSKTSSATFVKSIKSTSQKIIPQTIRDILPNEIQKRLDFVLPEYCALTKCAVPGCSCSKFPTFVVAEQNTPNKDAIFAGHCKKCHHGVLQHEFDEDEQASLKPSTASGQKLFSVLFQIIRCLRISASIYQSRTWMMIGLQVLKKLLARLKRHLSTGGSQNGHRTVVEIRQEQYVVGELHSLLVKAENGIGTSIHDELPITFACFLDKMYFTCYYASIVAYGRSCGAVPPPNSYFLSMEMLLPDLNHFVDLFLESELRSEGVPSTIESSLALEKGRDSNSNDLLDIYHSRFREGVRLFYEVGVGMKGEMDNSLAASVISASYNKKLNSRKSFRCDESDGLVEVPCYPLLAQWRNNCRDWCCHLYAYATPTTKALTTLKEYSPLVEIGAGTGYWASLLAKQGVDIVAYDKAPPSKESREQNTYHGEVPTFCSIEKGGPEVLGASSLGGKNLFLCYPPPNDDMAEKCLRFFKGQHVLHIGEWQGDTGNRRFENQLIAGFSLVKSLSLPNWGNTAYQLTIWERKHASKRLDNALPILFCFKCGSTDDTQLKRCTLCKTHVYCSEYCAIADNKAHLAEHAKRLVFLESEMDFEDSVYYAAVLRVGEIPSREKSAQNWNAIVGKVSTENS
jgi:hypothetical protein